MAQRFYFLPEPPFVSPRNLSGCPPCLLARRCDRGVARRVARLFRRELRRRCNRPRRQPALIVRYPQHERGIVAALIGSRGRHRLDARLELTRAPRAWWQNGDGIDRRVQSRRSSGVSASAGGRFRWLPDGIGPAGCPRQGSGDVADRVNAPEPFVHLVPTGRHWGRQPSLWFHAKAAPP